MQNTELYIDVLINEETHRINISHNEHVCDAEIQVDSKSVETKSKIIMNGGVLTFYIDGHESRLLILKKGSEYVAKTIDKRKHLQANRRPPERCGLVLGRAGCEEA